MYVKRRTTWKRFFLFSQIFFSDLTHIHSDLTYIYDDDEEKRLLSDDVVFDLVFVEQHGTRFE